MLERSVATVTNEPSGINLEKKMTQDFLRVNEVSPLMSQNAQYSVGFLKGLVSVFTTISTV